MMKTDRTNPVAVFFDMGKISSQQYGTVNLAGSVQCVCRDGLYPQIDKTHLQKEEARYLAQAVKLGLVKKNEKYYEKFSRSCFASLAAHTVPNMPPNNMEIYVLLAIFLFVLDDVLDNLLDHSGIIQDNMTPDLLSGVVTVFMDILKSSYQHEEDIPVYSFPRYLPFCRTLLHCKKLIDGNKLNTRFFNHQIEGYLKAVVWEFIEKTYTASDPSVSEETYAFKRRHTIGFPYLFELVLAIRHIDLGKKIRESLLLNRYMEAACNILFLTNDVFSLKKEILANETENIVLIRCRKQNVQQAFDSTLTSLNNEIHEIRRLGSVLQILFPDVNVSNFITVIENYLDGHLYWYFDSRRYGEIKYQINRLQTEAINDPSIPQGSSKTA